MANQIGGRDERREEGKDVADARGMVIITGWGLGLKLDFSLLYLNQ